MKNPQITTQITQEEKERLIKYCKEHDTTVARLLRQVLKEYFKGQGIFEE